MKKMGEILALMLRLMELKQTLRSGWNVTFPPGHKFKKRVVKRGESVADHSWSLAMFAFAIAEELKLDTKKMVVMALIHDIAEIITGDVIAAAFDEDERERLKAEKKASEKAAVQELFSNAGAFGLYCQEIWQEYTERTSPEALVLGEIDKIEACMQAVIYRDQGQQVDPKEFFDYTHDIVRHPACIMLMAHLQEYAEGERLIA